MMSAGEVAWIPPPRTSGMVIEVGIRPSWRRRSVLPGGGERHAPDRGEYRGGSESWETADTSVGGEAGGFDRRNAGQHAGIP